MSHIKCLVDIWYKVVPQKSFTYAA